MKAVKGLPCPAAIAGFRMQSWDVSRVVRSELRRCFEGVQAVKRLSCPAAIGGFQFRVFRVLKGRCESSHAEFCVWHQECKSMLLR